MYLATGGSKKYIYLKKRYIYYIRKIYFFLSLSSIPVHNVADNNNRTHKSKCFFKLMCVGLGVSG